MSLPRILVIDDQFANERDTRDRFCRDKGLVSIELTTSDDALKHECEVSGCQAGAIFTSGQSKSGEYVENCIAEVVKAVESGWPHKTGWRWALILLDLHFASSLSLPDDEVFGLRILDELVRRWPDRQAQTGNSELPIVMLSSISEPLRKRSANKGGVLAYVDKDSDKEDVLTRTRLEELLKEYGLVADESGLLVGRSYAFLRVLREARRVARMKSGNALILGPSGSGKTDLARYIHRQSGRKGEFRKYTFQPNVQELAHTDFFGYWKGAFTGALPKPIRGIAEEAHEGILFIDEVHSLTRSAQNEFLEFAEPESNGLRVTRRNGPFPGLKEAKSSVPAEVSDNGEIRVDLILIAATNEPLDDPEWRRDNDFRHDLYTRLATKYHDKPLRYPSLDERKDDIPVLFDHFLNQETREARWCLNSAGTKSVDAEVYDQLRERSWPGNIRDLSGIARAVALNTKNFPDVFPHHLPPPVDTGPPKKPVPHNDPIIVRPAANALKDVESLFDSIEIPRSLSELARWLPSLQRAYGKLVRKILEVALEENNSITPTLKRLFPGEIKYTTDAYDKLLKLSRLFDQEPATDSVLAQAIETANKNRGQNKTKRNRQSRG